MAIVLQDTVTAIQTSDYTADFGQLVRADSSGGGINVTPPPTADSTNIGRQFKVKNVTSSTNAITIIGVVDGVTNPTMTTALACWTLQWDGTAWMLTGKA